MEGNELHGERCANVGTKDRGNGLFEGHDPGIDEPRQHGHRGTRVGQKADRGAKNSAVDSAAGSARQDGAQGISGGGTQAPGHDFHAIDEQAQTAEDLKQRKSDLRRRHIPLSTPEAEYCAREALTNQGTSCFIA